MRKSLFGYGKTTRAIAEVLGAKFGGFDIYDDKFSTISKDDFSNRLLPPSEFKPELSEVEIASPGFPCSHELVKKARNLISEYDFFYDAMPKSVWISGTNGKTTTTQMTGHLLECVGAQIGANVGVPLANLDANARLWVLETSSFTLHYTKLAKPEIYALLPITPDHLSWHGDFEKYVDAKLSVLDRMCECDVAILPKIYAKTPCKAHIIAYENEFDLALKLGIDVDKINFKTPFLMDAVMALCIEKILLDRSSYELLNNFKMENNKLEEFVDTLGRLWVNDTKATNLDAAMAALKRYKDRNIHLIFGGDDKGVDLDELYKFAATLNVKFYVVGVSADKLYQDALKHGLKAVKCETLDRAVSEISAKLKQGEVGLLSPACASLDQFSSYAARGEKFKECVKNL